jgi:hypothetical protein
MRSSNLVYFILILFFLLSHLAVLFPLLYLLPLYTAALSETLRKRFKNFQPGYQAMGIVPGTFSKDVSVQS